MEKYAALISIVVIGLAPVITLGSDLSILPETIIPGNITGLNVTTEDGQSYLEYLRIPLKSLRKDASKASTRNSTMENGLNSNSSDTELPCSVNNQESGYDNCFFFNVYTTVNSSKANESLSRLPVTFYILQRNKQYPKYNPSLGEILVTVEDRVPDEDMDFILKETIIPQITLEWMRSAIEKFGGDPENIQFIKDAPLLEEPKFAVGYELLNSNYKTPIRLSESKKFIQRNTNSSVIALIEETTTLLDNDSNELTTVSP